MFHTFLVPFQLKTGKGKRFLKNRLTAYLDSIAPNMLERHSFGECGKGDREDCPLFSSRLVIAALSALRDKHL